MCAVIRKYIANECMFIFHSFIWEETVQNSQDKVGRKLNVKNERLRKKVKQTSQFTCL